MACTILGVLPAPTSPLQSQSSSALLACRPPLSLARDSLPRWWQRCWPATKRWRAARSPSQRLAEHRVQVCVTGAPTQGRHASGREAPAGVCSESSLQPARGHVKASTQHLARLLSPTPCSGHQGPLEQGLDLTWEAAVPSRALGHLG